MMYDTSHYVALMNNLSNEKKRLSEASTQAEIDLRSVWVSQLEKELKSEEEFLASKGVNVYNSTHEDEMSDDDILNELMN